MSEAIFSEVAKCDACGEVVPVSPRVVHGAEGFWLDIASPTCVSFSNFGAGLGLLSVTNLPLWVWAHQTLRFQPDCVLIENVPKFTTVIDDFLEEFWRSTYNIESVVLSPFDFGIPASGDRLFAMATRRDRPDLQDLPFNSGTFHRFKRRPTATGQLFTQAPAHEIRSWHDYHCHLRSLHPSYKSYRFRDLLTVSNRNRLEMLEAYVEQRGDRDSLFLNISQNPDFATISSWMPRLVTSSQIWSVQRQAVLTPFELLNVQGWPMHMPRDHYPEDVQTVLEEIHNIPWTGLTRIAGNGMNVGMFGHVLGVAVSTLAAASGDFEAEEH